MRPLTIYPAIDLKDGRCVRLLRGEMDVATVYNQDPAAPARQFAKAGFDWLHVVDLDGAVAGRPVNVEAVKAILATTGANVQLGGGVRDLETVRAWLDCGVMRVILGTAAVTAPEFVEAACRAFPGRIVLGLDARDGRVRTEGWRGVSDYSVSEIIRRFEGFAVAAVVYTDIARDGALTGVNVEATAALAAQSPFPVIASGGVSGVEDLAALQAAPAPIAGVIVGKAFYEKKLTFAAAKAFADHASP